MLFIIYIHQEDTQQHLVTAYVGKQDVYYASGKP